MISRQIPLHNRKGDILAYALVDQEDYERVLAKGRWCLAKRGYAYRRDRVNGRVIETKLHRFIVGAGIGDPLVDHKDRNPLNDTRGNLRFGTIAQNNTNRKALLNYTSTYRGVSWDKGTSKWRAQHMINGKTHYIGVYQDEDEAGEAARLWRLIHMPFNYEVQYG